MVTEQQKAGYVDRDRWREYGELPEVFVSAAAVFEVSAQPLLVNRDGSGTTMLTPGSQNADVYLGYTGWAAGGFAASYELNETPTQNGGSWKDTSLVSSCIVGAWKGA